MENATKHSSCCFPAQLQAGTPAGVSQCEAAAEGLIEALQQQEDVAEELQKAQAAAQQPEQQELEQQHEELQQQLRQLVADIKQRQRSIKGSSGAKQAAGRQEPDGEAEVVVIEDEVAEGSAVGQQKPDARQQRSKRRRT